MVCESWAARELWHLSVVSQGSACLAGKMKRELPFKMKVLVSTVFTTNNTEIKLGINYWKMKHYFITTLECGQADKLKNIMNHLPHNQ